MKIERMFSDVEEEKLYSTGNDELDELLERAFCEGYEYAQKEFARRDYEGLTEEGKAALKADRKQQADWLRNTRKRIIQDYNDDLRRNREVFGNQPDKLTALDKQAVKARNKSYQIHLDGSKKVSGINRERAINNHPQPKVSTEGFIKKNWNKLGKGGKAAVIGVPVAAAAIGTGMAIKNKKKKEEK